MKTVTLPAPVTCSVRADRIPGRAVSRLAARQTLRGGLIVTGLAAGMTAVVVAGYAQVMSNPAAARGLPALAGNPAIRTLFGDPAGLGTAGGFTVWRTGTVLAVLLGAWSILAVTRITRGEEDAGRWNILLAGRLPAREVLMRHVAAVMVVAVATGVTLIVVLVAAGTPLVGAVIHGGGTGLLGMFFAAVAALTAQVFPARSPATGSAIVVLGVGLLGRMAADGAAVLGWLHWLSPFGLLALSGPYVHNRVLPLIVLAAATVTIIAAVPVAVRRRDVQGGLLAPAAGRPPRKLLLAGVETFALRRVLRPMTGWMIGIGSYYLLIGLTVVSVTGFLQDNPSLADQAVQAGYGALRSVAGLVATLFAMLAIPVGVFTAVRIAEFAAVGTECRLTLLASLPVTRLRLLGAEVVVTAAAALVLVTGAGLFSWVGVTLMGGDLTVGAALRGVWNVLPVVLLSLGAAVFAAGWVPRLSWLVGTLPSVGGFLMLVLAESTTAPGWVRAVSPFAHLAPVPLAGADLTASAIMIGIAAALIIVGVLGYQRRDARS